MRIRMRHHPYNNNQGDGGNNPNNGHSNYKGKRYEANHHVPRGPRPNSHRKRGPPHQDIGQPDTNNNGFSGQSRYKGRNFDPNFHARRNFNNQAPQGSGPRGPRDNMNSPQVPPTHPNGHFRNKTLHNNNNHNHQSHYNPRNPHHNHHQQHQQHQQREQEDKPLDIDIDIEGGGMPMTWSRQVQLQHKRQEVWNQFRQEVLNMLTIDSDGDTHMCSCPNAGSSDCYHGIMSQYQKRLALFAQLQHDIARFMLFLASKNPSSPALVWSLAREFVRDNLGTPLQTIVESLFSGGSSAQLGALGLGIDFLADDMWENGGPSVTF
ncbi:hypothetical protein GGR50DRAFT_641102 [Xylaria sp. CBS 124048]|nr:hypothetical protein GGR50DRAFT_641102 [Xylaria sp. CBS 124048]